MRPHALRFLLLFAIAYLVLVGSAAANSGVPGPIIWAAGSLTVTPWQWVAATMFMCVGVEGAIYRYLGLFQRPVLASLIANVISLILGIPLIFLGAIDPTMVVLPTIVSIISEGFVLRCLPASIGLTTVKPMSRSRLFWSVIFANVVTNTIMAAYLFYIVRLHNGA